MLPLGGEMVLDFLLRVVESSFPHEDIPVKTGRSPLLYHRALASCPSHLKEAITVVHWKPGKDNVWRIHGIIDVSTAPLQKLSRVFTVEGRGVGEEAWISICASKSISYSPFHTGTPRQKNTHALRLPHATATASLCCRGSRAVGTVKRAYQPAL